MFVRFWFSLNYIVRFLVFIKFKNISRNYSMFLFNYIFFVIFIMISWTKFCSQTNVNHEKLSKMNKFCSDCEASNSTHVRVVNSILIEDNSIVSFFAFDEKNTISYENLFFDFWFFYCCSCCYCCVWCWCWFWFFDSSFRSRFSIKFSTLHDSKSYDHECSSWTRAKKKESQALQFESRFLFEKEKAEELFKKFDRVVRTMMYFYLKHVRKTINQNVKISKKTNQV